MFSAGVYHNHDVWDDAAAVGHGAWRPRPAAAVRRHHDLRGTGPDQGVVDATGRGQAVGPKDRGRAASQARAGRRPVPPVLAAGHGQVGQHRKRRVPPANRAHGRRRTGRLLARRAIAERQGGLLRWPGRLRRHGPAARALAENQVRNVSGEGNK